MYSTRLAILSMFLFGTLSVSAKSTQGLEKRQRQLTTQELREYCISGDLPKGTSIVMVSEELDRYCKQLPIEESTSREVETRPQGEDKLFEQPINPLPPAVEDNAINPPPVTPSEPETVGAES